MNHRRQLLRAGLCSALFLGGLEAHAQGAGLKVPLPPSAPAAVSGPQRTSPGFEFPVEIKLPALPEARLDLTQPLPPPRGNAAVFLPAPALPDVLPLQAGARPAVAVTAPAAEPLRPRPEALIPRASPAPPVAMIPPAPSEEAAPAPVKPEPPLAFREAMEALRKRGRINARDAQGIESFYEQRQYQPLWSENGSLRAAAASALRRLAKAPEDALTPARYETPRLDAGASADAALAHDLRFTEAVFLYARDARGGRINPARLSSLITAKPPLPLPAEVLATVSQSLDAGEALRAYNPRHAGYAALREKLASLDASAPKGLEADLAANMERWRWLPRDLGDDHVFVNIPEYALTVMQKGELKHRARVIVGKPETPTPVFSDQMQHLIVNPSWFIPPSILKKEILPGLERDPDYAKKRGFEVLTKNGVITGVKQPPGDRNALGYIKFMFPNEHAVYLHDTPSRGLFSRDQRAFSHGCVRVEAPFKLAEIVLAGQNGWSEARLRGMIGKGEATLRLKQHLPVHLAYFTHWVGENGQIQSRPDLYGFHGKLKQALAALK